MLTGQLVVLIANNQMHVVEAMHNVHWIQTSRVLEMQPKYRSVEIPENVNCKDRLHMVAMDMVDNDSDIVDKNDQDPLAVWHIHDVSLLALDDKQIMVEILELVAVDDRLLISVMGLHLPMMLLDYH